MATLQEIKRKIGSIRSTQTITRTMRMIAATKLRRLQDKTLNNRAYSERMAEIMGEIVLRAQPESHPFLIPREVERVLLVLITSDRGLCGGFNINLCNTVSSFLEDNKSEDKGISLYVVGKKGGDYFKRRGVVIKERVDLSTLEYNMAREIRKDIMNYYSVGGFDRIVMVYSRFYSVIRQEAHLEDLLPIKPAAAEKYPIEYLFEPEITKLLDQFIPTYIETQVYKGLLESQVSECAARMNAMDNATNNCNELINDLTLVYNKSRQASITKEMMDIVGGADALKS